MLVRTHVIFGGTSLLLTMLRLGWWLLADRRRPGDPAGLPHWQALLAKAVHGALYAVILVMGTSGIATLILSGALPPLLAGAALPDFSTLLPRLVHGLASRLLLALLVLHVAAALYHQFVRRDRLLARMGIGSA